MSGETGIVIVLGSGPNALGAQDLPRADFDALVVINNAWRVRSDWTHAIWPEDFPPDRHPSQVSPDQHVVTYREFVPGQNAYGGFVFGGGTMAYTAAYWALWALRPRVMAFLGCDMVYPRAGQTHFYGTGTPDPLRDDVTLQSLPAKSARLALYAAREGCHCVNLSRDPSRLVFPRADGGDLRTLGETRPPVTDFGAAEAREAELGYFVESGRYWPQQHRFDAQALRNLDAMWLRAYRAQAKAQL